MIRRYALFAAVLAIVVLVAAGMKPSPAANHPDTDPSKYIKFSHAFHVKEQGIACTDCHHAVMGSKDAADNLMGDHESCKSCHQEQIDSTCSFCHVDPENIVPIPHGSRQFIFSHERHAAKDSIACETCHPGIDNLTYATEANIPTMKTCVGCHEQRSVARECATCHTNFATLIPADHREGDFKKEHSRLTRLGELSVTCATCHTESFCQDCHSGAELHGFGSYKDLMADPLPRAALRDGPAAQKLQKVHDLNYRFTHASDAMSKRLDCASCHEEATFCVQCHQAGGNITQQKFIPSTHTEAGFVVLGKGSGGGRHAELAKRDLETCAACHDVQGTDPTCLRCHTEGGAVR
jgi:hypothetical protein